MLLQRAREALRGTLVLRKWKNLISGLPRYNVDFCDRSHLQGQEGSQGGARPSGVLTLDRRRTTGP